MKIYFKNWFFYNNVILITVILFISFIFKDIWQNEIFRNIFFKIGLSFCIISTTIWSFFNHHILFKQKNWLRILIVMASCCTVFLFTYKLSKSYKSSIVLLILCGIYAIWKRKYIKPELPTILFGCFALFHILGGIWNTNLPMTFKLLNDGEILFLFIAAIISLFYRMSPEESKSFITICFKGFLSLLAFNFTVYILYIASVENSFFCFFTFNKAYLSYYEILSWTLFKHPSYISWVILLIGGLAYFVWKEQKDNKITTLELIAYAILLLFFAFIMQARITIIGYALALLLFAWLHITRFWAMKIKIIIVSIFSTLILITIAILVTKTTFFSDPIRMSFFKAVLESNHNIIFGAGTAAQREISESLGYGHLHNDFLSIWVDLGTIGLLLVISWIISTFYQSIIQRNHYILYTLLLALMFMSTDTFLYLGSYMSVWFITVFFQKTGIPK